MKVLVTYRQICVSLLMMMVVVGVETVGYSQAEPDMREGSGVVSGVPGDLTRALVISSGNHQRSRPNMPLKNPLIVRVLDADTTGVAHGAAAVKVIFRVRVGQGRLSTRGNGRAVEVFTNASGFASVPFTPTRAGIATVHVSASGAIRRVTFIITTDLVPPAAEATGTPGATRTYKVGEKIPLSTGNSNTLNFSGSYTVNETTYTCVGPGECVISHGLVAKGEIRSAPAPTVQRKTYKAGQQIPINLNDTLTFTNSHTVGGTTYTCVSPGACVISHGLVTKGEIRVATKTGDPPRTTRITPVVHVAAAQRPPMLWIDEGAIYTLVGETGVERFAPSVNNALHITVGSGKVYWTEITGQNAGTINSANLDGSGVKELAAIEAIPMGIAVDTGARQLYWTNSRGRIQMANLDGSNPQNMLQTLDAEGFPTDITVDRGTVYWIMVPTQAESPKIGVVTPTRPEGPKYISTRSANIPKHLAVSGGKVYWTEETGTWQPITASERVFIPDGRGTINSVNLNFTGATQLAWIQAMPVGIAVDAARSTLYWTNSRGRIQAANLEGSGGIRNVVTGLAYPGDMVISNSIQAPASTGTTPTTPTTSQYDVNGDGTVDNKDSDALVVAIAAGITDAKYDVNADGKVDINDIVAVTANHNSGAAGAPALIGNIRLSAVQIDRLQEQIELLIATGDRSPAAMKTLIYLQQLIALARPEKTQLLTNYPNPFNPETWIPYELATDTDVRITIYTSTGVVVRTLPLGQQSAGYYTDRERAAYWDGRNALGEQVASGIYFYQLETDDMSSMRKMVILK